MQKNKFDFCVNHETSFRLLKRQPNSSTDSRISSRFGGKSFGVQKRVVFVLQRPNEMTKLYETNKDMVSFFIERIHQGWGVLRVNWARSLNVQCETTSERRMLLFLMHSTARWRARKTGSKMAVAGLLFFAWKKNSLRTCSARGQQLAQARRAWCCGPKKRLPVLTTHRWRAHDMGSVVAAAGWLFFAF